MSVPAPHNPPDVFEQIFALLTPEQQAKAKEFRKEFKHEGKERKEKMKENWKEKHGK